MEAAEVMMTFEMVQLMHKEQRGVTWTMGVMNIHEPPAQAAEVARGRGRAGALQASFTAGVSAVLLVR